jgi:hypothetical protein
MASKGLADSTAAFEKELNALDDRKQTLAKDLETIAQVDKKIQNVLPEPTGCTSEDIEIRTRDSLLRYYSSECTTHGAYILSTAVGIFAFFQVASEIDKINFLTLNVGWVLTAVILSGFITISILFVARIIYWGTLTSVVTHVGELSIEEAKKGINPTRDKITFLLRLHRACVYYFTVSHTTLNHLVGVNRKKEMRTWYVILFTVFTAVIVATKLLS